MSRRRSKEWAWLEGTNVYFKKGRYVVAISFNPYQERFLAPGDASRAQVLTLWEQFKNKDHGTIEALVDAYKKSEKFRGLKPGTQNHYSFLLGQVTSWEMPRLKQPFGSLPLNRINNKTIQSAFDQQEPTTSRNRRFTVLKAVFSWGVQHFPDVEKNPVMGLEMPPEKPRDKYIYQNEWDYVYSHGDIELQLMMEGAYLLRGRRIEIASLHRFDSIKPDGVFIDRRKGSYPALVEWSARLRKWVRRCKNHYPDVHSPYLVHDGKGQPISATKLRSMWKRAWRGAPDDIEYFTYHDIKARGVTDHPDQETGDRSKKMDEIYIRENRREKPTK